LSVSITPNLVARAEPRPARVWAALCLVFAAVYVGALWTPSLLDDADSTHAAAAQTMARTGDLVTLKVNGVRYLEKAPLPYWLAAAGYRLFGENAFATRLPVALAVFLGMVLAVQWAGRAYGARAGAYAGLFYVTGAGTFLFTRIFIPEALLSVLIAGALYCFLTALEERRAWRWYAGYALLACAVLTKGLIALVFVGNAAWIFLLLSGEWRRWREFRLPGGLLLVFLIAAPWHILAGLRNTGGEHGHGFFWFYFVNEHFLRFLGRRLPRDYNKMPALAYWLGHVAWLFPWSLWLPLTVRRAWERLSRGPADRAGRTTLLCTIYSLLILIFFAFSTNQEYYTFPVYLPLLILIAGALAKEERESSPSGWVTGAQVAFAFLGLVIAAVLLAGLWQSRHLPYVPDIASVLARRGVGDYTLSLSRFFDLTGASFAGLRLPALLAAVAFLAGPLVAWWMRARHRHAAATWATALTMTLFLMAAHLAFARFETALSSRPIADALEPRLQAGDRLVIVGDQAAGSSLLFYLRRPVYLLNGATTSMYFGSTFPDAPAIFYDDASFRRDWDSPMRMYVFLPEDRRPILDAVVGENKYEVLRAADKIVYTNHP
jgi:4-amino-4-deoxy-L-arabinose transferase-like glycosyltransferase